MTDTPTRNINLDAKRAARAEARKSDENYQPPSITLGGITYELPAEMPVDFAEHVAAGRFSDGFRALFDEMEDGDEKFASFMANDLTVDDMKAFSDDLAGLYGVGDSGNSLASGNSSKRTTKR